MTKTEAEVFALLKDWGDGLLKTQIRAPEDPALDGGLLCPACGRIHGRCQEAVYPLLYLADRTGDGRYLSAAKALFAWGGNLLQPDGSVLNDADNPWKGVTAFGAVALHDALRFHGGLLTATEKAAWETRLRGMGAWLFRNLRPGAPAYINYYAANACAMALLGVYFDDADYRGLARALAEYCAARITENGILTGEGRPHDARTAKGCAPVDLCYNVEESLPALRRYAETLEDAAVAARCRESVRAHLDFLLPDGGWDDSACTRAFKWAYWGSRTADGCTDLLFALGKAEPMFSEAALRNLSLLRRCTRGGLLYGGPGYGDAAERPCVHHTFCHAKSLAAALEAGIADFPRTRLPAETAPALRYVPETDLYRLRAGSWIADITGYDFLYRTPGVHTSGGSVSLLWHASCGPVLAAGMADPGTPEPHNMQPPRDPAVNGCVCPRLEAAPDGRIFAQHRDYAALLRGAPLPDGKGAEVRVSARLCDETGTPLPENGGCTLTYTLTPDAFTVEGRVAPETAGKAACVLPAITPTAAVKVLCGTLSVAPAPVFALSPGFLCREYRIVPDPDGRFALRITVDGKQR